MAAIILENLVKSYGEVEVLYNVKGEITDGELIVIVGPSGCGKSTLLRMIAGLEKITAGEISIGGKVVNNLEPADRDIAMVFQNYALYPHMSVRQNMAYGLKIRKTPKDEIEQRVNEAAEILGISQYLDRKPRQLSGGQRQRVAMGRAIVRKPQVFLFDEPLSNLDAKLRVQMRLEIRKLQKRLNVTSIYVTHDQVEAMTLGDRLMVLNGGVVEQFGTPIELYDHPETIFVAGFIGSPSMNFIPAECANGTITLSNGAKMPGGAHANGSVTLGLRSEHLTPDANGPIRVVVQMFEHLGANTLMHGTLEKTNVDVVVSLPGHVSADAGSVMTFSAFAENMHIFDTETGKRVVK
jgi:sn-glycerol 3-phosphate transport system ATP-binding protein